MHSRQNVTVAVGVDDTRELRHSLVRLGIVPGWIGLALVLAVSATGTTIPRIVQLLPFAVSLLVLGLPHGAVDHLAPWRVRAEEITPSRISVVGGLYLLLGSLVLLTWLVTPVAAFVCFILVTWLHWGQGELYPLIALVGVDYLSDEPSRWLAVFARGSLPMLVPLVAFPEQYQLVAETLVGTFGSSTLGWATGVFTPVGRAVSGAIVGVTCGSSLLLGYFRTDDRRPWLVDVGEVLFLTTYFLVVPPILAVGAYFCLWHSLRHVIRLVALDERAVAALEGGDPVAAGWQFVRDATPLTLLSIGIIAGLAVVAPQSPRDPLELVGVYLVAIAAMTVPHVVIVAWLDREQGIWLSAGLS
jgi:Brp/Blh family beta-carotene 15,15'-monooxygenase